MRRTHRPCHYRAVYNGRERSRAGTDGQSHGNMPDAQPAPVGGPLPRGYLLALKRSFRRTLEAENKSPRTVEAYTDAVRFLARQRRREHIQGFIADQLARWKPATAHNRYGVSTP
jgi:hypothetical protein